MSIAILIALRVEAAALIADPRFDWKQVEDGLYRSGSANEPLTLVITGVGKVNAAWGLARSHFGGSGDSGDGSRADGDGECDRLVISMGTSGALDATPVGTLILCDEFVEHDMDVTAFGYPPGVTPNATSADPVYRTADSAAISRIAERLRDAGIRALPGRQLSGDLFLGDATVAERARGQFGGSGATLVDMECAAIAKICATIIKIPYLAIRYVSDNADHDAGTSWNAEVGKASVRFDDVLAALVLRRVAASASQ